MTKRGLIGIVFALTIGLIVIGCVSVPEGQLSPNNSQSVVSVRRSNSNIEKGRRMEIFIDGRSQNKTVENGGQGQVLVMNGLHNIQVKVGKLESQMLTFDCSSEVVEFMANFEGKKDLHLTKLSGGNRATSANSNQPSINITVDNSSSNTANSSSSGNTSNVNVGDDNSVR